MISTMFYKCPHCRCHQARHLMSPERCPCGAVRVLCSVCKRFCCTEPRCRIR